MMGRWICSQWSVLASSRIHAYHAWQERRLQDLCSRLHSVDEHLVGHGLKCSLYSYETTTRLDLQHRIVVDQQTLVPASPFLMRKIYRAVDSSVEARSAHHLRPLPEQLSEPAPCRNWICDAAGKGTAVSVRWSASYVLPTTDAILKRILERL